MKKEGKRLTLRQIATLAHTSKSTVSRVLTKHPSVSPRTRARIESVISKQGFRPNLFARGLAGGKTGLVAVLAAEINSGFYAEVIKGIDEIAGQHDGHLLTSFAHGDRDFIRLWKEMSEGGRVDGIILIAPPMGMFSEQVEDHYVPSVLCACRALRNRKGWGEVDSVVLNNQRGFEELMQHLVAQGCRYFVHVAGPADIFDGVDRRRVFEKFIESDSSLKGDVIQATLTREGGRAAVHDYLSRHTGWPDAFVAFNDDTALGVLEALRDHGIAVPTPVAVAGCDDEPASTFVGLTTLHMPMVELGRETARLLFNRMEHRGEQLPVKTSMVDLSLRVRGSSRRHGA